MPKKSLDTLTETMFYILMAFASKDMCGTEITEFVQKMTGGRVAMGPGTLYTNISRFLSEKLIIEKEREGRKITYSLTEKGRKAYEEEIHRLRQCLLDAERMNHEEDNSL